MHFHTGTHVVAQLFGMSVNLDTIFTQWLTALIVFIIVFPVDTFSVHLCGQ